MRPCCSIVITSSTAHTPTRMPTIMHSSLLNGNRIGKCFSRVTLWRPETLSWRYTYIHFVSNVMTTNVVKLSDGKSINSREQPLFIKEGFWRHNISDHSKIYHIVRIPSDHNLELLDIQYHDTNNRSTYH